MDDSTKSTTDEIITLLEQNARREAFACLEQIESVPTAQRKSAVRSLRDVAENRPELVGQLCSALVPFLEDSARPVRLTTAKLFVSVARSNPDAVVSAVSPLADRLSDEGEFYYVRARAAEALGFVAISYPDEVASPSVLADLRVGLAFDEPEVKEKLAKALECVALGDPSRLRHHVSALAAHLDDESELVRYHLTTALVVLGCEHPERLTTAGDELTGCLDDDSPYVRGRAAEALGLLAAEVDRGVLPIPTLQTLKDEGTTEEFVRERVQFALSAVGVVDVGHDKKHGDLVGCLSGIRRSTETATKAISAPNTDSECPHCGLPLPDEGPPMCPRCGTPN
ncbi:HEAT repeat domain-containing protein (plasmid) [Haloferax sp. S1W]|uniref:HEAT repeat domain-containing protein n=1 Tax=Haloferax sp. S1W TaxID=3377110 RepID=UPI0037C83A0C